jgi:uncharacterized protein
MTDPLERALLDACLGQETGEDIARNLRGFLEARGVATEDVDAIVAAPHRLAVYRSLVRNGLAGVVVRMLPRTRARLNTACAGRFDADLARFLAEVGPRTHYLRDVPGEFFAWARPLWTIDSEVPAHLPDLAAHELACFGVAASESRPDAAPPGEVTLDRPIAFADSTRLVRYAWAVHELAPDEPATDMPARRDVDLLAYRDEQHAVRWLELSPLAAAIVRRLLAGDALQEAIGCACEEHGTAPAAVATDVARLLSDLAQRGVLLGARRS